MDTFYDVKEMLKKELDEIVRKGELSAGSLETIDKLLNSIKNACKIVMYDEYSEDGYSSANGNSEMGYSSRGNSRNSYAGGRYSSEGGYSGARSSRSRGGYSRAGGRYSSADGENEEKIEMLQEMMGEVSGEERRALQKIIRKMEQE